MKRLGGRDPCYTIGMTPIPTEPVHLVEDAATGDRLLIYGTERASASSCGKQQEKLLPKGEAHQERYLTAPKSPFRMALLRALPPDCGRGRRLMKSQLL